MEATRALITPPAVGSAGRWIHEVRATSQLEPRPVRDVSSARATSLPACGAGGRAVLLMAGACFASRRKFTQRGCLRSGVGGGRAAVVARRCSPTVGARTVEKGAPRRRRLTEEERSMIAEQMDGMAPFRNIVAFLGLLFFGKAFPDAVFSVLKHYAGIKGSENLDYSMLGLDFILTLIGVAMIYGAFKFMGPPEIGEYEDLPLEMLPPDMREAALASVETSRESVPQPAQSAALRGNS